MASRYRTADHWYDDTQTAALLATGTTP